MTSAALPRPYDIAHLTHVRRRHYGRWLAAALILVAFGFLAKAFAEGQIAWTVVGQFFTAPAILQGLWGAVSMTFCAMALGIALGVLFAVMAMSPNPVLKAVATFYIWFFRGTPLLLQLLIWFNLALVFPRLGIPGLFEARTVDVMTPFMAALLGLGVDQGAYTAEVVRSGILSVDLGQTEAAKAIGMTRLTTLRRIVLPQAMRVIIPPVGNEVISMVKLTSVASVIGYAEILRNAQTIYYANARVIELLIVAAIWYLIVVTVLQIGQYFLETALLQGPRRAARRRPSSRSSRKGRERMDAMVAAVDVHKYFGALHALAGVSLEVAARRGVVHHRPFRLGQEHVPALHQPARARRTRARSSSTARSSAIAASAMRCTSCRTASSRASGSRAAWCSSASTCSST